MASDIVVLKSLPGICVLGRLEIPCYLGIVESSRIGQHLYAFRLEHIPRFLRQLASLKEQGCEHSIGSEGRISFCMINGSITFIFPELEIKGVSLTSLVNGLEEIQGKRSRKGKGGGGAKTSRGTE